MTDSVSADKYPADLRYHPAHDWVRDQGELLEFGITWHAQDSLGDIVFFQPPEVGYVVKAGESYGELESVKAVSDIVAPMSGEVVEVNTAVVDSPELVNADPYGAWLVRVSPSSRDEAEALMTAEDYERSL